MRRKKRLREAPIDYEGPERMSPDPAVAKCGASGSVDKICIPPGSEITVFAPLNKKIVPDFFEAKSEPSIDEDF